MNFEFGVTVAVRRPIRDRYGDITARVSHSIDGCALSPQSSASGRSASSEQTDRRETVSTDLILHAPPGSDILAIDEIQLADGTVWQVVGDIAAPSSPFTGWTPGVRVVLNRTTG